MSYFEALNVEENFISAYKYPQKNEAPFTTVLNDICDKKEYLSDILKNGELQRVFGDFVDEPTYYECGECVVVLLKLRNSNTSLKEKYYYNCKQG